MLTLRYFGYVMLTVTHGNICVRDAGKEQVLSPPQPTDQPQSYIDQSSAVQIDAASHDTPRQQIPPVQNQEPASERVNVVHEPKRTANVDRFTEIQGHVSALRFIQGPGIPIANKSAMDGHTIGAAPIVPLDLPDFELLDDDMDDIEAFISQSQTARTLRQSTGSARQTRMKETGLSLRLQQAQRQIMLLKQHIQSIDGLSIADASVAETRELPEEEDLGYDDDSQVRDIDKTRAAVRTKSIAPSEKVSMAEYEKLQKEFMVIVRLSPCATFVALD